MIFPKHNRGEGARFSNHDASDRRLLGRLLGRAQSDVTLDERLVWAHTIDRAIKDAASGSIPFRARVARPTVVLASAPTLVAIAAALRDEDVAVSREVLDAVHRFMTDGIASPLYGGDPLAARRGADALRSRFAGADVAGRAAVMGAA